MDATRCHLTVIRLLAALAFTHATAAPIEFKQGEVVAFAGGTDLVRMQKDGYLEACLTQRFLDKRPKFRDLAWDGDTVYFQGTVRERWRRQAFGDWRAQLDRVGATVVIAQFGKIESLDGIARLGEFKAAYRELLEDLTADGRRVVLLAPSPFETGPAWRSAATDAALAEYTETIRELAGEAGTGFVGHGGQDPAKDFAAILADQHDPGAIIEAVREKHRLWYDYWRPANWKCLFGDDGKRVFSNAAAGLPSFKEEWSTFPALIAAAEEQLYRGQPIAPCPAPTRSGSPEAGIAAELAAFEVADGYEVNLFADESQGIANPLSLRWAADGRMFVACSDVYPQIEPGVRPDDHIVSLLDRDGDGHADESVLFASGLNIPTGMEVGAQGIYVGQNTELLLLDWKGGRKVLLSGFGNGDSHQTINSFVWGPAGDLWFCQGDGVESRVETPSGLSSLFQAGVFRLRPETLKLDGLLDDFMGPGNPWGVAFDDFGQSFVVDGAGGISYLTPASIPAKHRLRLPRIGDPGGYCGVECVGGGEFLIGDYKKNQVSRFRAVDDGAGFKVEFEAPLLRSKHRNFRPIDVKLGPDGAIYVVDWYNPITCHQDDFYRHPDRDQTHGRIWRVARNGAAPVTQPMAGLGETALVESLKSDNRWIRLKAKQALAQRGLDRVPAQVRGWVGRDLLEAVALLETLGIRDLPLLGQLLASDDHRARAYAARVAGTWNAYHLLEIAAADGHPRVRMEALLASAQVPEARSILIAAAVAQRPRDRWIDYAFAQAVHHLKPQWLPAFRRGELDFADRPQGLAAVLGSAGSKELLDDVRQILRAGELLGEGRITLLKTLIAVGGEQADIQLALDEAASSAEVLRALAQRERPALAVDAALSRALASSDTAVKIAALDLVRRWRVQELTDPVSAALAAATPGTGQFQAAARAFGTLAGQEAIGILDALAGSFAEPQPAALLAILENDPAHAARRVASLFEQCTATTAVRELLVGFGARDGAIRLLGGELAKAQLSRQQAGFIREQWLATGVVDDAFSARLDALAGVAAARFEFSEALVNEFAAAAQEADHARGKELFASPRAGCIACHRAGENGGIIGPDLSAVGSGVLPERIVTEVLWPARQIKEGYSLTRLTLKDGQVMQGYEQPSRDARIVLLRDFAGTTTHEVPTDDIALREALGSLMPPTAQGLSREEIADLCAFLISLGR